MTAILLPTRAPDAALASHSASQPLLATIREREMGISAPFVVLPSTRMPPL